MRQEKLAAAWAGMTSEQRLELLARLHTMSVPLTPEVLGADEIEFDALARRAGLVAVFVQGELPGAVGPCFARGYPTRRFRDAVAAFAH